MRGFFFDNGCSARLIARLLCLSLLCFGNDLSAQSLSGILPLYDASIDESSVNLTWNLLPEATSYNVQLSQDPTFVANVQQSGLQVVTNWTTPSLGFGVWYWRVEATTPNGIVIGPLEKFTRFDPSVQSNLSLWLKADAGVTLDGSNLVQSWTDQSPSAFTFTQATVAKRPTINPTSFGGYPTMNFSGGTKVLSGGDVLDLGLNSRSFYVIGQMAATNQTFFSKTIAALAPGRYAIIKDGAQTAFICQSESTTQHHIYSAQNSTGFGMYNAQVNRTSAQARFSVNGNLLGVSTINAGYDWNSTYRFLIGAYNNATDNGELLALNGNISEMVFVDTENPTERLKTENYLKYKYHQFTAGPDVYMSNFCDATINLPAGFTNILWSNGATSATLVVSDTAFLSVQATDPLGFIWRDTVQVTYPAIPPPVNTGICVGLSNTWNADMGSGFTYLWSNGQTTPSLNITTPGDYHVVVTDAFGCFKSSDTLTFTIDNYETTAFLGADTNLCVGNLLALQVGAAETQSYTWPNGSTGNQYAVDTTGNYFVESVNVNGCLARDTIQIIVVGIAPNAAFSFTNVCDQSVATFTDNSQPVGASPIDVWLWDFGDNSTSTNPSPTHTFPAAGEYEVELYVSQGGCGAYRYDTIVIYSLPVVNPEFLGHCQGEAITFVDSNNYFGMGDYTWQFNCAALPAAQQSSFFAVPNRTFDTAGVFNIFCQYTDENGCLDSLTLPLTVDPTPQLEYTFSTACETAPIQFTFTGETVPNSDFLWSFGGQASSTDINPLHSFSSYGDYTIDLTVTNEFSCADILQNNLTIHPLPQPQMGLGPYCAGTYMTMNDASTIALGSINATTWVVNQTDTLEGTTQSYLITSLGQQQVELLISSDQGCTAYLNQFIDVQTALNASFTSENTTVAVGEPLLFVNTSLGANASLWNLGDGFFLTDTDVEHTYESQYADSTLQVTLIVMNTEGCLDTATQLIQVLAPQIDLFISTVFLQQQSSFYSIGVQLVNNGSVKLTAADLFVKSENGQLLAETWGGDLSPGEDTIFVFNGQLSLNTSSNNGKQSYICVSGTGYDANNVVETDLSNNLACKPVGEDELILMTIAPNPVSDQLSLGIILSQTENISIQLLNYAGQLVSWLLPETTLNSGTYNYAFPTDYLRKGVYFVRLVGDSSERIEKVLVNN
jgi:PKD repeat protein